MKLAKLTFVGLLLLAFFGAVAAGDTVVTNDGHVYEGRILDEGKKFVHILTPTDEIFKIDRENVKSITYDDKDVVTPGAKAGEEPGLRKKLNGRFPYLVEAFDWFIRHQTYIGMWDGDNYNCYCEKDKEDYDGDESKYDARTCMGEAQFPDYDIGLTGLVAICLLDAGVSPAESITMKKTLAWLKRNQWTSAEDPAYGGLIALTIEGRNYTYGHAMATIAMLKGYMLTGNVRYLDCAKKALGYIVRSQSVDQKNSTRKLGWRYRPNAMSSDTNITGWMTLALHYGTMCGIEIPEDTRAGIIEWMDSMANQYSGRVGYQDRGDSTSVPEEYIVAVRSGGFHEACSAIAVASKAYLGLKLGADELMQKTIRWIDDDDPAAHPPISYYYWYWGTRMYMATGAAKGPNWMKIAQFKAKKLQEKEGCARGSWNPRPALWGKRAGRVYTTAIVTSMLLLKNGFDCNTEGYKPPLNFSKWVSAYEKKLKAEKKKKKSGGSK